MKTSTSSSTSSSTSTTSTASISTSSSSSSTPIPLTVIKPTPLSSISTSTSTSTSTSSSHSTSIPSTLINASTLSHSTPVSPSPPRKRQRTTELLPLKVVTSNSLSTTHPTRSSSSSSSSSSSLPCFNSQSDLPSNALQSPTSTSTSNSTSSSSMSLASALSTSTTQSDIQPMDISNKSTPLPQEKSLSSSSSSLSSASKFIFEDDSDDTRPVKRVHRNPIKRLTKLLIEEAKIADRERMGEKEIQTILFGDESMEEPSPLSPNLPSTPYASLSRRSKPIPGSALNPSNKCHPASPISSATPSPTYLNFPVTPSPFFPTHSSTSSSPPPLFRHFHFASSTNSSLPPSSSSSTTTTNTTNTTTTNTTTTMTIPTPHFSNSAPLSPFHLVSNTSKKRNRILFEPIHHPHGPSLLSSHTDESNTLSPHSSPSFYLSHSLHGLSKKNASKQQPQLLNIQGASAALDKLGLDE